MGNKELLEKMESKLEVNEEEIKTIILKIKSNQKDSRDRILKNVFINNKQTLSYIVYSDGEVGNIIATNDGLKDIAQNIEDAIK